MSVLWPTDSAQVGFVVVLSGLCEALYLPLYTARVEQTHKQNSALPHGGFCWTRNSESGRAGSFCPCPLLPTHHIKHRVLTAGFGAQLAAAQPVSPESRGGLVLACVPVVMAPSLGPESAFPTRTITFSVMLFSVFLWGRNIISEWESCSSLSLKLSCTAM